MSKKLEYKGYHANICFDEDDLLFVGDVYGIQDSLNFCGYNVDELVENFHHVIDDYLDFCKEVGKSPDKEYKGSFNVRMTPELHRKAAAMADSQNKTLNQFVIQAVELAVSRQASASVYHYFDEKSLSCKGPCKAIISKEYISSGKSYPQKGLLS